MTINIDMNEVDAAIQTFRRKLEKALKLSRDLDAALGLVEKKYEKKKE